MSQSKTHRALPNEFFRSSTSNVWKRCHLLLFACLLMACSVPISTPPESLISSPPATLESADPNDPERSTAEWDALNSLVKVDPYPLYVMTYSPDPTNSHRSGISDAATYEGSLVGTEISHDWGCALLSVVRDRDTNLFGRNFDWRYSPGLLLFYQPVEGYRSVTMVDLDYLFDSEDAQRLDELSMEARSPLLAAYNMPFDGMNAQGLVIGMAAVPYSELPLDPRRESVDSLAIMRRILDLANDVEEALEILADVRPNWGGGPALHYLISDSTGRSVLVEFIAGEMVILESGGDWQVATNFLQQSADKPQKGQCWRYDLLQGELEDRFDVLSMEQVMDLLALVAQDGEGSKTQWSIVYDFSKGDINVVVGGNYSNTYRFNLPMSKPALE